MIGLLHADILRLRGRSDVLLVIAGIVLIHSVVFLQAFSIAKADAEVVISVPPPPTETEEFIRSQEEYRVVALAGFAVPTSVTSMMRPGFPVLLAGAAFLASLIMGSDFEWGTVRGSVLLAGSRRRFILVRHVTIWAIVGFAIVSLVVVGLVAPLILSATGAPIGWSGQSPLPALTTVVPTAFQGSLYASMALAVTIAARSFAGGVIGAALVLGVDGLLSVALQSTQPMLARLTISGSLGDLADPQGAIEPALSLIVALAWLAIAVAVSIIAIERRDILE